MLLFFRGPAVTATLDGKPHRVNAKGRPVSGALQIGAVGEYFAVKTIEFRELADPSLVGHWTFDVAPNGNADDFSGSKNDAKLEQGAAVGPGRIGSGVHFDGKGDRVSVPSSPSLTITGPMTIAAWINPGPLRESYSPAIVEKFDIAGPGAISGYILRLTPRGHVLFKVSDGATGASEIFSVTSIPPNTWTFVTGVFENGAIKLYVNGVLEKTKPAAVPPGISKTPLRIGMSGGDGGNFFTGAIDDVRIYARALPEEEIVRLAAR
jgi:hypothetical protein